MAKRRDIFIAYSFGDGEYVSDLANELDGMGLNAWYAQSQIRSGHWRTKVEDAIDAASLFVVLVSAKTGQSRETENEYRRAESIGKPILPVFIEKCSPPLYLAALHSVMLYEDRIQALKFISEMVASCAKARRSAELSYLSAMKRRFRERADSYTKLSYEHISEGITTPLDIESIAARLMNSFEISDHSLSEIRLIDEVFNPGGNEENMRFALIGEPGAGKSTTLAKLFIELSEKAALDSDAPIPVFLPLKSFSPKQPFRDFVRHSCLKILGQLAPHYDELLTSGRLALLMDGMNELPEENTLDARFRDIISFIAQHQDISLVITCLSVDYTPERNLGIETYKIIPLNPLQVRNFIARSTASRQEADEIFWSLLGDERASELLDSFKKAGGTEAQFWTHNGDSPVPSYYAWKVWIDVRDNPFSLLTLARNPYLLTIIILVRRSEQKLSANRFELFSAFFALACKVAQTSLSTGTDWIEQERQRELFTQIAKVMLDNSKQFLSLDKVKAALSHEKSSEFLRLAEREKLLEVGDEVAFPHQLLRAYFGSFYVESSWINAGEVPGFPNPRGWWLPSPWEESVLLLAGKHARDPVRLLTWLRDLQPELVSRCLTESGCTRSEPLLQSLTAAWVPRLQQSIDPPSGRAAIGRALGRIGRDGRPGVLLCDGYGLPVIEWVEIPESKCFVGNLEHPRKTPAFEMSKYLITNAQFEPFIRDGGYTEKYQHCWSKAGWDWCQLANRRTPDNYTEVFCISNHPRIGTVWYEVYAYSRWLTERLRTIGALDGFSEVRLPTEAEWEAAARGPDAARKYPWGNEFDYDRCNVKDIRSTTAVGIFPTGASPEGVFDLVGNAWSWCLTKWDYDPLVQDNSPEGDEPRVYRGGSWAFDFNQSRWKPEELQCDQRYWIIPRDDRPDAIGFFLVKGQCLNS